MTALCLDLSSVTGWCVVGAGDLQHGVWRLAPEDTPGRMMASLRNEVMLKLDWLAGGGQPVTHIVIEQTLPAFQQKHTAAVIQQGDLAAVVKLLAWDEDKKLVVVSVSSARLAAFGRGLGRISSKDKEGGLIVRKLREQGFDVHDHNAADAIVLALWAQKKGLP